MLNDQGPNQGGEAGHENEVRDIHALNSPHRPPEAAGRTRRRDGWETSSPSRASTPSEGPSENFTTMSREFNAMVLAGSSMDAGGGSDGSNLARIGEDDAEEINPLAIVPDHGHVDPVPSPRHVGGTASTANNTVEEVSVQRVKKEEIESKISAWQTAKIAKINNRFKREDAVINGWEGEEMHKATSTLKKIERKLEEKRARALEKMQNDIAKAHRKAEEKRASAEAKRGTKVARVLELANLMRAVGRTPSSKRSFF
ncbi:hypothetical protein AAC387_Pa02g2972 [Persea americana]